ncbi:MAG: pilus assembly protein [Alphaproteobacteria bacterium]|nr:pilus assembly protein [Alphaproteobacteria bacterium]
MTVFRRFANDGRGVALVETGFVMILLMTMILGVVEIARFVLLNQKLDRAVVTLADLVSVGETISVDQVNDLMNAVQFVMQPFELGGDGVVLLSSVGATGGGAPMVNWQQSGAGQLTASSHIGAPDDEATLPSGLIIRDGESVIIAEIYYQFRPLMFSNVGDFDLYYTAYFRPRLGFLTELEGQE